MNHNPSPEVREEIRNRIKVAVWAYAYEMLDTPLVSDAMFDGLALTIRPRMDTSYGCRDNSVIDEWFRKEFHPSTGNWIHKHPNLEGIVRYYKAWTDKS